MRGLTTNLFSKGSTPFEQHFEVAFPEDLQIVQIGLDIWRSERK